MNFGALIDKAGKGPWFPAGFDGECTCGDEINEDDLIRADGDGGWEAKNCCGDDDA